MKNLRLLLTFFRLLVVAFLVFTNQNYAQKPSYLPPIACQTIGFDPSAYTYIGGNNIPDVANPYYLRVYFHIIQRTDGTGGHPINIIDQVFNGLNSDFNSHGIYFVKSCEVNFIKDDLIYFDGDVCTVEQYYHSDGIDVFLMPDENTHNAGAASSIPANHLFVGGIFADNCPFNSLVMTRFISHEMGHCLGLFHTRLGSVDESAGGTFSDCVGNLWTVPATCPELVDGTNWNICGDFIKDTPADPSMRWEVESPNPICDNSNPCAWTAIPNPNNPRWKDSNGDVYNPDEQNIMGYSHPDCWQYFSQGQGMRMREMISISPILQACLVTPGSTTHINTNNLISTDIDMPGDLVVHSGSELIIEAKIGFPEGAKIVVERNARLVINNGGVVTRDCYSLNWEGIKVLGNDQKIQPDRNAPLNDPSQAGIVWIENGTVEWARTGVSTAGGYNAEFWGGLIWTNIATFRDNRRDAEFMSYKFNNKSRFYNTQFFETGVGDPVQNTEGVTIWSTNGIEFHKCKFKNKDLEGILTYDASVKVYDGSEFSENETGIWAQATFPMSGTTVVGAANYLENEFTSNKYHINTTLVNGLNSGGRFSLEVVNNNFADGNFGVLLDGSSNFIIGGNKFTNILNSVRVLNTGVQNPMKLNYVGCNTIVDGSNVGISAIGENKEMQFLGNDFRMLPNKRDFWLLHSQGYRGAIRRNQGGIDVGAGNCFTNPGVQPDIRTNGTTDFFSYYWQTWTNTPNCDPEPQTLGNYNKLFVSGQFNIVDCSKYGGLPTGLQNPTFSDLMALRSQILQLAPLAATDENVRVQYDQATHDKETVLKYLIAQAVATENHVLAENLLLGESNADGADWAIFGLRMYRRDYSAALQWLNQIQVDDDIDAQMKIVQLINIQRLQNPTSYQLSDEVELSLLAIAESQSPVRGYARGILGLLKNMRFYPELIESIEERSIVTPIAVDAVLIVPNPASNMTEVSWQYMSQYENAVIQIFDAQGTSKHRTLVASPKSPVALDVNSLPIGVYFLVISEKGKVTLQTKLTVQH